MTSKTILDLKTLNEWQQIDPENWRTMVVELIDIYLSSASTRHKNLQEAWSQRNFKDVSAIAHALKSSCGNVGAVLAQTLLNEIEEALEEKDVTSCGRAIRELEEVFPASVKEVTRFKEEILRPLEEF